jgi:hypothetical protein
VQVQLAPTGLAESNAHHASNPHLQDEVLEVIHHLRAKSGTQLWEIALSKLVRECKGLHRTIQDPEHLETA